MSNNSSTHFPLPQHSTNSLALGTFGCAVPFPALIFSAYSNLDKNWAEKLQKVVLQTEQPDLSNSCAGMPSIPPICQHHGQLLSGASLADPRGSLLLIVVLYIPVIFTYSPILLPCFWKAKLLLSILVCIPWEWSLGSVLPSCRLCFSSFSNYDGWKSSGGAGWVPLRPRLLVANLPQVPAREITSHYLAHLCSPWGWYGFKRKQTKADIRGKLTWKT